jgi:Yip1 domain
MDTADHGLPVEETPSAPDPDSGEGMDTPPTPGLHRRILDTFFSPGKLAADVARDPRWLGALLFAAFLIGLQFSLIPADVFAQVQREAALRAGRELPEISDTALRVIRIVTPIASVLSTLIFATIFAGLYTLIFAFILGDEGKFKQYLAVTAHSWIIPAIVGLALTPLRISTENPQLTLNLGSFLFFLPEGYLLKVFTAMDITQIWAALVVAQGVHTIDDRRSFGSAAAILILILFAFALVAARLMPS